MPGVPRSTGCNVCKARRVKCDESWPTCKQCKRRRVECPGPSSLFKFVQSKYDKDKPAQVFKSITFAPQQFSVDSPPEDEPATPVSPRHHHHRSSNRDAKIAHRLLPIKPPLSTVSDLAAARLIQHLQSAPDRGLVFQTKYLKHLPKYLENSPSLRDSLALFCTAWDLYSRGQVAGDFRRMPSYIRAVGSLRRLLDSGEKACSVETLASITILGRTEYLFGSGKETQPLVHELGISSLNVTLGPPGLDDEFHTALLCEDFILLVPYWMLTGKKNFMAYSPWRELAIKVMADSMSEQLIRPYTASLLETTAWICDKMSGFMRDCWTLQSSLERDTPEMITLATTTMNELRIEEDVGRRINSLLQESMRLGLVVEEEDPCSLTPTCIKIQDVSLAQVILCALSGQVNILKMRYDCSRLYGSQAETDILGTRFRDLCHHIWKYLPWFHTVESFVAVASQRVLYPTLEAANKGQKEYILDILARVDRYRKVLPYDRDTLEKVINTNGKLLTGRIPVTDEAKMGGASDGLVVGLL